VLQTMRQERREVLIRRRPPARRTIRGGTGTVELLECAEELEGLAVALSNVDDVIELIKKAQSPADAKNPMGSVCPPPRFSVMPCV